MEFLQSRKEQIRKELNDLKKKEVRQRDEKKKEETSERKWMSFEFKQASASQGKQKKLLTNY